MYTPVRCEVLNFETVCAAWACSA